MIKLAIFDVDGTLVDSGMTIHRALEESLDAHGHACPPRKEAQKVIGLSLTEAMAQLVPHGDHRALAETYKNAFVELRQKGEAEEHLYAGVEAMLDAFEADGWLLGMATGKSDRGLQHLIEQHGWEGRFVSRHTADRHPSKPDPSMVLANLTDAGAEATNAVMIGDTGFDMAMAVNAGVSAIGVDWGYHDDDELTLSGASVIARRPEELLSLSQQRISIP